MSSFDPADSGQNPQNPFQGIFGDIARLLSQAGGTGPLNWDVARQVAALIAGQGTSESNIDPVERIHYEGLVHAAELHVAQASGMTVSIRSVETFTHIEWAMRTLEDYKPLLERLAQSLGSQRQAQSDETGNEIEARSDDPLVSQLAQMEHFMGPMLFGMQAGGMVGQLSRRSLALFDLPIPRPNADRLVLMPQNINAFADDWSMQRDELAMYVIVEELTKMTVLGRPHVAAHLNDLLSQYASGFRPDSSRLEERMQGIDMSDPNNMTAMFDDPRAMVGAMQTEQQRQLLARISAIVSVFAGFVDHVTAKISTAIIPSAPAIAEAAKRRRVEESSGQRVVEELFGLELNQTQFDRGQSFVNGVVERAGKDALLRLWRSERELPTPAEADAPGLWLERIDLPTNS